MPTEFSKKTIELMKQIPPGKVCTYGQIATLAGNNRGARQVVRLLNSSWKKENLPWHRIVNSKGTISLRQGDGYEMQKSLLEAEGIEFNSNDKIDFSRFLWQHSE
ncbi:MAG: DNA methyltransferase [Candidatus Cloacimonadota bacterium]|nr:MAG: DNA methyltransferase [Candidatus Cloacimonadota bacterium]